MGKPIVQSSNSFQCGPNCSNPFNDNGAPALRYFRFLPRALSAANDIATMYDVPQDVYEAAKTEFIRSYREFIETLTKNSTSLVFSDEDE